MDTEVEASQSTWKVKKRRNKMGGKKNSFVSWSCEFEGLWRKKGAWYFLFLSFKFKNVVKKQNTTDNFSSILAVFFFFCGLSKCLANTSRLNQVDLQQCFSFGWENYSPQLCAFAHIVFVFCRLIRSPISNTFNHIKYPCALLWGAWWITGHVGQHVVTSIIRASLCDHWRSFTS